MTATTTVGTVLQRQDIPTPITGATATRITYVSHDVNGARTESSGLVIAPSGTGTDRPVLTWCHGTTGLGDASCPSAQPDPARELVTYFTTEATQQIDYGVPGLQKWIDAGYVVCATDYQGLGTAGVHQYMVSRTQARDAIAIVHAARTLDVGAGTAVAVAGWSQGGGTAAAVAELPDSDFGELHLFACAPISPGVALAVLATPVEMLESLTAPTTPPDPHVLMMVMGHAAAFHDLDLDDVLTPLGRRIVDAGWNTQPVHHLGDTATRLARLEGPLYSGNPTILPVWREALSKGSAGRHRPRCPVLLCIDTFDGGTVVPVLWQQAYAGMVTDHGGDLTVREYPHADHFSVPVESVDDVLAFVQGHRR